MFNAKEVFNFLYLSPIGLVMETFGKKKKKKDLIGSAMDELAAENANSEDNSLSLNDSNSGSLGILGKGIGQGIGKEVSDPSLLENELPSGLDINLGTLNPAPLDVKAARLLNDSSPKIPRQGDADIKTSIIMGAKEESFLSSASTSAQSTHGQSTVIVNENPEDAIEEKISFGVPAPHAESPAFISSSGANENLVVQAENLRIAQKRISELEKELEKLRAENEAFASASTFNRDQANELNEKLQRIAEERSAEGQQFQSELAIYKDRILSRDFELNKQRQKISELEKRLQNDLRKIRVRERELENRIELLKLEKDALLKSKDETILELKSKLDQLSHENKQLQIQIKELTKNVFDQQQQMSRTARALRLALTNLEVQSSDSSSGASTVPLKKAE